MRKLLVEMDAADYNRFNLFDRLVKRVMAAAKADEATVLEVIEKSVIQALEKPKTR